MTVIPDISGVGKGGGGHRRGRDHRKKHNFLSTTPSPTFEKCLPTPHNIIFSWVGKAIRHVEIGLQAISKVGKYD